MCLSVLLSGRSKCLIFFFFLLILVQEFSPSKACGISPDQKLNPCLCWRVDSLPPSHQGSPVPILNVDVCFLVLSLM